MSAVTPGIEPPAAGSPADMTLPNRYQLLGIIAATIVVLDQATKRAIVMYFGGIPNGRRVVVNGFFDLVLAHNPGAAFSSFAHMKPDWLRGAMFIAVSAIASVVVVLFARRAKPGQSWMVVALSLILGGALGNLVDRVLAGEVVDFLEFYSRAGWMVNALSCDATWGCRFPAFNVADSAITVGTALLILVSMLHRQDSVGRSDGKGEARPGAEELPAPPPAPVPPASSLLT